MKNLSYVKRTVAAMLAVFCVLSLQALCPGSTFAKEVPQDAKDFLNKMSSSLAAVAEVTKPSVVNVSTTTTVSLEERPFGEFFNDPLFRKFFGEQFGHPGHRRQYKSSALGSGVIVSSDGYILTNYHVIKGAQEIKVILYDGREFKGKVIGDDPPTDIAVLKINARNLPAIKMGESKNLKAGDVVLAIGNPFGLNQTVTMGIVSAVGRADVGISSYEDFIQTDAAINPGNSGGAMVNANGELVGINTAIFSTSGGYMGIGFAIPSDMANTVAQSILKYGKVIRSWLGVTVQDLTPALAQSFGIKHEKGALVTDVTKNSPADKAGFKRGDLIVGFDGKPVENSLSLRNMVVNTPPGKTVDIRAVRGGRQLTIKATLSELTEKKEVRKTEYENVLRGVHVEELSPDIRANLNIPADVKGVVVAEISEGSPAAEVLMKNDVIQEIDRKPVSNLGDYEKIVEGIGPSSSVLLLIYRNGGYIYVTIKP
ncbi:MAG: DegQ family serine endoprotease [Candidatus Sulfobium sp.]|jgi:serine protease Do